MNSLTVAELVERFLAALKLTSAAPATYNWYAYYLKHFAGFAGDKPAAELTNSVVYAWLQQFFGDKADSTQHAAARAVVRCLNWAVEERLLAEKPLRGFRKPTPSPRESQVTLGEYAQCLRAVRDSQRADVAGPIRDVIRFLWHAGCRPQELRIIEARWIDGPKITLPKNLSKGKRKKRVIYLNDMAKTIVTRLSQQWPEGPIFRNTKGEPWTKNGLTLIFRRLRGRTGIEGLCPYAFRHSFITRLLEKGVDAATVAALAGNSTRMVLGIYNHVNQNEARMLAQLIA